MSWKVPILSRTVGFSDPRSAGGSGEGEGEGAGVGFGVG